MVHIASTYSQEAEAGLEQRNCKAWASNPLALVRSYFKDHPVLGSKCSSIGAYRGQFTFRPWQEMIKRKTGE